MTPTACPHIVRPTSPTTSSNRLQASLSPYCVTLSGISNNYRRNVSRGRTDQWPPSRPRPWWCHHGNVRKKLIEVGSSALPALRTRTGSTIRPTSRSSVLVGHASATPPKSTAYSVRCASEPPTWKCHGHGAIFFLRPRLRPRPAHFYDTLLQLFSPSCRGRGTPLLLLFFIPWRMGKLQLKLTTLPRMNMCRPTF